jgi:hypothetical protein
MDSHEHVCQHHSAPTADSCASHGSHTSAEAVTCGGAGPCGGTGECAAESDASCGHCTPLAMPVTDERVTLPANDLATLLDLVEAFAGSSYDEDGAYSRSDAALRAQAPNLVAAREQLLETFRAMAGRAIASEPAGQEQ